MISFFIQIRILDVIDILLIALIMYNIYMLVRGTVALNIIIGIIAIYILWGIVKMLKMELVSSILGQIIGVGVIALIIVFQQEIRRFLLIIGTRYIARNKIRLENFLNVDIAPKPPLRIKSILKAVIYFATTKTGALIVIKRKSTLDMYSQAGDILDANTSSRLLISLFNKQSPMHDGAIIIENEKIHAARVVLPVNDNPGLPPEYGLRHRAAIAITELTDAFVIVVSEETGHISIAESGKLIRNISQKDLMERLDSEFQAV